jgi:hypothetical protein
MRCLVTLLLLSAAVARGDGGDPPGTVLLRIEEGESTPLAAPAGTSVICDDPRVVVPEFATDGSSLVLRALKPGSTLCGLWLGHEKPGGLYRVIVRAKTSGGDGVDGKGSPASGDAVSDAGDDALKDAGD